MLVFFILHDDDIVICRSISITVNTDFLLVSYTASKIPTTSWEELTPQFDPKTPMESLCTVILFLVYLSTESDN